MLGVKSAAREQIYTMDNATVSVNQKSISPTEMKHFGVSERKSLKKRSRHLQTRIVRSEIFAKFALPFRVFESN